MAIWSRSNCQQPRNKVNQKVRLEVQMGILYWANTSEFNVPENKKILVTASKLIIFFIVIMSFVFNPCYSFKSNDLIHFISPPLISSFTSLFLK